MTLLGIGVDIVACGRVERLLSRHPDRLDRLFSPVERLFASRFPRVGYAILFAAKEAVMKSIGTGWRRGTGWSDIRILPRTPFSGEAVLGGGGALSAGGAEIIVSWDSSPLHAAAFALCINRAAKRADRS